MTLSGMIVDIAKKKIYPGSITIENAKITNIQQIDSAPDHYILPGLIDAHIHIESSMLTPAEFARIAVIHGTVATVSDPHEIANVLGIAGVDFMQQSAAQTLFNFYFSAPSCVPATNNLFETSGATLGPQEIDELLTRSSIKYLGEVMNVPGVLHKDPIIMKKIASAQRYCKPIDGHAPGLIETNLKTYINSGITTDHECFTYQEALEKIKNKMIIQIRNGSAAKNFDELAPLLDEYPNQCMLCSDDLHPNDLVKGHINLLVKRAIDRGFNIFNILQAACINPVTHYKLDVGTLRPGDFADFIIIDNLKNFNVKETYIKGKCVAKNNKTLLLEQSSPTPNKFDIQEKNNNNFIVYIKPEDKHKKIRVIQALDGQLITKMLQEIPTIENNRVISDISRDIIKIAVINRYNNTQPSLGFIKNTGLKRGAIATSVAHDSHNIIATGINDNDIARAVNRIINYKGGMCVIDGTYEDILPLPIAGLMSDRDYQAVAQHYTQLDTHAKEMGASLQAPFMTLSFMALLVIPELKLSDKGLFDGSTFKFVDLFV